MTRLGFLIPLLVACSDKADDGTTGTVSTTAAAIDGDGDGFTTAVDCNDSDAALSPDAIERCDGTDNDCDGEVDEGVTDVFYADADGDGFGAVDDTVEACEQPEGYVGTGTDCDDAEAAVFPGGTEVCDGLDNDCDGDTDEDGRDVFYPDEDGDGYGDADASVVGCDSPSGHVEMGGDCDDTRDDIHPGADESDCTDPTDYNCDGEVGYTDGDGDGWAACEECDDAASAIHPAALEVCDGTDNNCDGLIDDEDPSLDISTATTWYEDADGDGYGDSTSQILACEAPSGFLADSSDCDDASTDNHPAATEVCEPLGPGVDNDCDGLVDDDDPDLDASTGSVWYADDDGDGYGAADDMTWACDQPSGHVLDSTDCDDADDDIHPAATEICTSSGAAYDDDCDGDIDDADSDLDLSTATTWYADADADGFADADASTAACDAPSGYLALTGDWDCDDTDDAINPGATEICESSGPALDNDCDGDIDDDDSSLDTSTASVWYGDADGDGHAGASSQTRACAQPSGYLPDSTDCDDADDDIHPDATEICDELDNDCDGDIDDDDSDVDASDGGTWYADSDGDGYGDPDVTGEFCVVPSDYLADDTDCDDADAEVHPGATDRCDGEDDDCDGDVDEDALDEAMLVTLYGEQLVKLEPGTSWTTLIEVDTSGLSTFSQNSVAGRFHDAGAYLHDSKNDRLVALDTCDGTLTAFSAHGAGNLCGTAFDNDGRYWGLDTDSDELVELDLATGAATTVGGFGVTVINCAMTYDCATDTLYAMDVDTSTNIGTVYSVDRSTGALTHALTLDTSVTWSSAGIAHNPIEGVFYASTEEGVFEIDPDDGSATELWSYPVNNLSYVYAECD